MIKITRMSDFFLQNYSSIYCFGAGVILRKFANEYSDVKISAVLDNYKYLDVQFIEVQGKKIKLVPSSYLSNISYGKNALIITSKYYEEIITQLDRMELGENIDCYIYECNEEDKYIYRTEFDVLKQNFGQSNINASVKKYQIWEYLPLGFTAGSKARYDVKNIAGECGYEVVPVHIVCDEYGSNRWRYSNELMKQEWEYCLKKIETGSILLIQTPTYCTDAGYTNFLKRLVDEKKIHIICLFHDVEALRGKYNSKPMAEEFQMIKSLSHVFIVHNNEMKKALVNLGILESQMISLNIFDYMGDNNKEASCFKRKIVIAGNLASEKSPYIGQLKLLKDIEFELFGPNFEESYGENNINYNGIVSAHDLPRKLTGGFGLVWDGQSIDGCTGETGEYLKYNNPHKLSLYLFSGLPVLIWDKAAEAEFVINNKVGYSISSLKEIPYILNSITNEDYSFMIKNVYNQVNLLGSGFYTKTAIAEAEAKIMKDYL